MIEKMKVILFLNKSAPNLDDQQKIQKELESEKVIFNYMDLSTRNDLICILK